MKKFLNLLWIALACSLTGCVNTVTQNQPGALPVYRDRIEGRYQQPVESVFEASKRAVNSFGNITSEGKVLDRTNDVRVLEGNINGRNVYVRVEALEPQLTSVIVQVRTRMGGTDLNVARDVIRRLAVELE